MTCIHMYTMFFHHNFILSAGARKTANKFFPYSLEFELAEDTTRAATERQLRLLGYHGVSNYG